MTTKATTRQSKAHAARARVETKTTKEKAVKAKAKATTVKKTEKRIARVPSVYRQAITAAMETGKISTFTFDTPEELKNAAYSAWGARRLMALSADVGCSMTDGKLVIGPYNHFVKEKTPGAKRANKAKVAKDEETPKLRHLADGSVTVGVVKKSRAEKSSSKRRAA